jgi:RpiR family transcriptional regulator, carbohydrate utilization regulator
VIKKISKANAATPTSLTDLLSVQLSETSDRVRAYVLANPSQAASCSIAQLAQVTGVSEPSVARFCQAVGFAGWKAFRLWLVFTLGTGAPYVHIDVRSGDDADSILNKVIDRSAQTLLQLKRDIASNDFAKAVRWLVSAQRIEFYGQGNSGITAADGAHKFFRLGFASVAYSDPHLHCVSAAMLKKSDVVVALSNSGKTQALVDSMVFARDAGAKIIALTVPNTPVADSADLLLPVNPSEDPDLYAPMTSRIAQLVLIDALAVATASQMGSLVSKRLERYKAVLNTKRIAKRGTIKTSNRS